MNYTFDNAGVNQLQEMVLALPDTQRSDLIQEMLLDFRGWMTSWFNLNSSQVDYLYAMPESLAEQISTDIAHCWQERIAVLFYKETRPFTTATAGGDEEDDDDDGGKEIIVSGRSAADGQRNDGLLAGQTIAPLTITIRYRQ